MSEYIDAISDDYNYLKESRELVLADKTKLRVSQFVHSLFCRMLSVHIVNSIEYMLQHWQTKNIRCDWSGYFARGVGYSQKIEILYSELSWGNDAVDRKVIEQYIAIKLLRNSIVHSNMGANQRDFIVERGLPDTLMGFTPDHWSLMQSVYEMMMEYIAHSTR